MSGSSHHKKDGRGDNTDDSEAAGCSHWRTPRKRKSETLLDLQNEDVTPTKRARSNSGLNEDNYQTKTWNKEKAGNKKQSASSQDQYLKKYKGDIINSSEEYSDFENYRNDGEGKMKERKYSNQLKECSDYSSKEELLTDKPAKDNIQRHAE